MKFLIGVVVWLVIAFCVAVIFNPAFAKEVTVKVDCQVYGKVVYELAQHAKAGGQIDTYKGWPDDHQPMSFYYWLWNVVVQSIPEGYTPVQLQFLFLRTCMEEPKGELYYDDGGKDT